MGRRAFVKDRIEEAAFDLFARRGYEAVTTREVAAQAKVGHASMYRHYASMEELGRVVYGRALAPLVADLRVLEDEDLPANKSVQRCVRLFCGWYDEKPRALALLVFPPHDFVPQELEEDNPYSPRRILQRMCGCEDDTLAVLWGAITGPLQDRYLRRRNGLMSPAADALAKTICRLV